MYIHKDRNTQQLNFEDDAAIIASSMKVQIVNTRINDLNYYQHIEIYNHATETNSDIKGKEQIAIYLNNNCELSSNMNSKFITVKSDLYAFISHPRGVRQIMLTLKTWEFVKIFLQNSIDRKILSSKNKVVYRELSVTHLLQMIDQRSKKFLQMEIYGI